MSSQSTPQRPAAARGLAHHPSRHRPLPRRLALRVAWLLAPFSLLVARPSLAADQWASSVVAYSSQYAEADWSAQQVLGPPDVPGFGDDERAWCPSADEKTKEFIEVAYATPVHATGVTVFQTCGTAFLTRIEARDTDNVLHTLWEGTQPAWPQRIVPFRVACSPTPYLVKSIVVSLDTDLNNGWEEIDAIQLHDTLDARQWATEVLGFSSQFGEGQNSAQQALGPPNVRQYGDSFDAWAPYPKNGTTEFVTLGFPWLMHATGAVIRESYGNGFVYRVDLLTADGAYDTVWTGTDASPSGDVAELELSWPAKPYLARGMRIYVDTNHDPGAWEEIDAAYMVGTIVLNPTPTLASISPTTLLRGGPGTTLVATGQDFVPSSQVQWNGKPLTTTFVSPERLTAVLTPADVSVTGAIPVTVLSPSPGGGTSNALGVTLGPAVWGDADGNGLLALSDAVEALRIAAGLKRSPADRAADVSPEYPAVAGYGEGRVDVQDAVRILRYLNRL